MEKIVLIWPFRLSLDDEPAIPLWALSLSTYLSERIPDVDISILDGQIMRPEEILEKIDLLRPDIAGISLLGSHYGDALMFARKAKSTGAKVVIGGGYATAMKEAIIENRGPHSRDYCFDVIIQGDGEKAFYEYVAGRRLREIKNLVYQGKDDIIENPTEVLPLDDLGVLKKNLIDLDGYFKRKKFFYGKRHLRYDTTYCHKGCWWRNKSGGCIFCSDTEGNLRTRKPLILAKELEQSIMDYRIDGCKLYGDDFFGDMGWVENFVKVYRQVIFRIRHAGYREPFLSISVRADRINNKTLDICKKINVRNVLIGFESGDQKCLASIRKGISVATIKKAVNLLNQYGIKIFGSFIFGAPGEEIETLERTLNLMQYTASLKHTASIRWQMLTPIPGSLSWQMLLQKTDPKYRWKDLIDWDGVRRDWLRYFCRLNHHDIRFALKKFQGLSKQYPHIRFFWFDFPLKTSHWSSSAAHLSAD